MCKPQSNNDSSYKVKVQSRSGLISFQGTQKFPPALGSFAENTVILEHVLGSITYEHMNLEMNYSNVVRIFFNFCKCTVKYVLSLKVNRSRSRIKLSVIIQLEHIGGRV